MLAWLVGHRNCLFLSSRSGLQGNFSINPSSGSPFHKYAEWNPDERITKDGEEKFSLFCGFLSQFSKAVVNMAEKGYFGSEERSELSLVMSWMMGCTEYGLLSTEAVQIGYYDRIEDERHPYLEQSLAN